QVLGHGGGGELLLLHVGVHQAKAVLAGKLPARTIAAMRRLVWTGEVAGTAIGLLAAALAFAEEDRLVLGDMECGEFVLENEAPTVLARLGIRRRRIHGSFIKGDHVPSFAMCKIGIIARALTNATKSPPLRGSRRPRAASPRALPAARARPVRLARAA